MTIARSNPAASLMGNFFLTLMQLFLITISVLNNTAGDILTW